MSPPPPPSLYQAQAQAQARAQSQAQSQAQARAQAQAHLQPAVMHLSLIPLAWHSLQVQVRRSLVVVPRLPLLLMLMLLLLLLATPTAATATAMAKAVTTQLEGTTMVPKRASSMRMAMAGGEAAQPSVSATAVGRQQ